MMFRLLPAAAMTATALAGMTAGAATVDVYGVVDTGLHYVKADSGDTSVTMDSGISKGSRVGLIGSEDLGGGYKIVFNLETGFSLDDGSFDNTKNGSVRISVSGEVIPGAAQRGCPLYLRCSMPDLMR